MYEVCRKSTIRFIVETMKPLVSLGGDLQYIDWDAHADESTLPATDLIGINGFAISDQEGQHEIYFGVMIATLDDPNLFRQSKYCDAFYKAMRSQRFFDVYHAEQGIVIGKATMLRNTAVAPVSRSEARPIQAITGAAVVAVDPALAGDL